LSKNYSANRYYPLIFIGDWSTKYNIHNLLAYLYP